MGILIRSSSLAAILRRSKRQPTRVLRFLMEELFTHDELRMSTVRGKKGKLPALDTETMDAILCKFIYQYQLQSSFTFLCVTLP